MNFLFRLALLSNSFSFVDGPGFGMRHKPVEVQVPWLPTEFCAPLPRIPSPPVHIPLPLPAPESSPAPPVAGSSRLRKRVLCKFYF